MMNDFEFRCLTGAHIRKLKLAHVMLNVVVEDTENVGISLSLKRYLAIWRNE